MTTPDPQSARPTVLIIDDDAARASAAAAALEQTFRCIVGGATRALWRADEWTRAGEAGSGGDDRAGSARIDIVLISSRVRATVMKNGGGHAERIVLADPADAASAVVAIEAGAADAIVCSAGWLDSLAVRIHMSLARAARRAADEKRRRTVAASLTRSRQKNKRLRSLVDWLQAAAATDPLTGLANRRGLEERLRSAFNTATRYGTALSVLAIDLDNLKVVNDTLGHAAGDEVLAAAGRVIREQSRLSDSGARVGGDEFVVLLPHTGPSQAGLLAARIQRAFDDQVATVRAALSAAPGFEPAPVGISVGIASIGDPASGMHATPDDLLQHADRALYAAKRAGKGRVEISVRHVETPEIKAA